MLKEKSNKSWSRPDTGGSKSGTDSRRFLSHWLSQQKSSILVNKSGGKENDTRNDLDSAESDNSDDWFQDVPAYIKHDRHDQCKATSSVPAEPMSPSSGSSSATTIPAVLNPVVATIKQETRCESEEVDIEDVSSWLQDIKAEPCSQTQPTLDINDMTTWLDQQTKDPSPTPSSPHVTGTYPMNTPTQENANGWIACPLCQCLYPPQAIEVHASDCDGPVPDTTHEPTNLPDETGSVSSKTPTEFREHVREQSLLSRPPPATVIDSDDESECSVIDLCDGRQNGSFHDGHDVEDEEDDGYLSPLEGFASLHDLAHSQPEIARYLRQGITNSPSTPATGTDMPPSSRPTRQRRTTQTTSSSRRGRWRTRGRGRGRGRGRYRSRTRGSGRSRAR